MGEVVDLADYRAARIEDRFAEWYENYILPRIIERAELERLPPDWPT